MEHQPTGEYGVKIYTPSSSSPKPTTTPQPYHEDPQTSGGDTVTECSATTSSSAISEALALADMKREAVRKSIEKVHSQFSSIGLLALQWKDVEDHFASLKQSIERQWKETVTNLKRTEWRTKRLNNKEKDLAEKCKEIDATYVLVSRCYSTVLEKEMEYSRSLQEAESVRRGLELMLKQTLARDQELNAIMRVSGEKLSDKEEFHVKKQSLDLQEVELSEREMRLSFMERVMSEKSVYFENLQKKFKDRCNKLQKSEDELRRRSALVKLREGKLELKERALSGKVQNLDIKQKKFEQEYKAFKEKERCVDSMLVQVKEEPVDPQNADIRFYITMNGRELQRYLSGRLTDFGNKSLHNEVRRAFLLSANPAKLVLDALHGFYPSLHSETSDQGLGLEVLRRTCIFLLERFRDMCLNITPEEEKERAKLLAIDWRSKIRISDCHRDGCLEIVGFLQLVACYRLVEYFDEDELLKFVEMVSQVIGSGSLRESLGIRDKTQDIGLTTQKAVVDPDTSSTVEEIDDDVFSDGHPKFNTIVLGLKSAQACSSIGRCHSVPKRIIKRKREQGKEVISSNRKNHQVIGIQKPAVKKKKVKF